MFQLVAKLEELKPVWPKASRALIALGLAIVLAYVTAAGSD